MTSVSTPSSSDYMIKPLATAGLVVALDQMVLNESNLNNSIIFGVSAAAGVYAGMMIGYAIPDMSATLPVFLGNGKGLIQRVAEVGFGGGVGYGVNKFVFKNNRYKDNMTNRLGVLAAADIGGEYITDFIQGRPLSILS
jgi:hypothetical protein